MRHLARSYVLVLCLLLGPGSLLSQVPFSGCVDRHLQPIPGRVDNTITSAAVASREGGHPVILWNQHNLSRVSTPAQLFVYLHECAHHNLNHLTKGESRSIEDQADCWAYQLLVDGDMLNGSQLDALESDLRRWPGDINHLGGERLLQSVRACVAIRTDPDAWKPALQALVAAASDSFHSVTGPQIIDAPPGVYEALQGTPGTFDCEVIQQAALRCLVYAGRKQKAAEKRFSTLADIVDHWLPSGWMATRPTGEDENFVHTYIAQDGDRGTLIVLGVTATARVYFFVKPAKAA